MWQMEDIMRAVGFDIDKLDSMLIRNCDRSEDDKNEWREWFQDLINMML